MKILSLIIFLFFACGIMMVLCMRLQSTYRKLSQLHEELQKNERRMHEQRREMEREAARQEVEAGQDLKT